MCCIIYIPENVPTPDAKILESIYKANNDSVGYVVACGFFNCYFYDWMMSFDELIGCLNQWRSHNDPCIIHFRKASRGEVSEANCQPMMYAYNNEFVWFAHNGTLHNIQEDTRYSDSYIFFHDIFLPKYLELGWDNPELWNFVNEHAERSRMIFMHNKTADSSECDVKLIAGDPTFRKWECIDGVYYSRKYDEIIDSHE